MTGREQNLDIAFPDGEAVAVSKQPVPLCAVCREGIWIVVDVLPEPLDVGDLFANGGWRAGLVLKISGGREMVGMRVSIEDPFDHVAVLMDELEDLVGRPGGN